MERSVQDDAWSDTWTAEPTGVHRITQPSGVALPRRADVLELVDGPGQPEHVDLIGPELTLGRGVRATCRVRSSLVSREHLHIAVRGTEVRVTDLDSQNGVYLNQVRIHSAVLRDGDLLQLGDLIFVFRKGVGCPSS